MPKKNMTDEEKRAWGQKMKAAREKKVEDATQKVAPGVDPAVLGATVAAVLKELGQTKQDSSQVETLYSVEAADYPDIRERLYDLPELARKAMRENYELEWAVEMSRYQRFDGQWVEEPKFRLTLLRRPTAEELADSREKGGKLNADTLLVEGDFIQFEDDAMVKSLAPKLNLKVGRDFDDYEQLRDEIRFERFKQAVVTKLIPPVPGDPGAAPKELAVGGSVVKVHSLGGGEVMVESEKIIR